MICKKLLLLLVLFLGHTLLAKEGLAHKTKRHCILCSEDERSSKRKETVQRRPYSAPAITSETQNNALRTEHRARNIDQGITGKITDKRRKKWSRKSLHKQLEHFNSTSRHIQDRKRQTREQDETQFKDKYDRVLSSRGSNTKPAFTNSKAINQLEKRTFVSAPPRDIGKISEHDIHLSETILSALKLILDKRNSFQNESEALRLASVLLTKDDDKSQPKVARTKGALRSEMKRPIPATKGMNFVVDVLSGANAMRGSLSNARKSSIMTDLVDPTELGVSILRLLFGPKASLVTKPKYKTLLKRISAKSKSQDIQSDSGSFRGHHSLARPTLSRIRGGGLQPRTRSGQLHISSLSNSHETTFNLAKKVSQLIAKLNRKYIAQRIKAQPLFHKSVPASSNMMGAPAKINVDVNGRRKSWVLLKIPKGNNPTKSEQEDDPSPDKSDSNSADSNNEDVSIIGKMHPLVTTSELQSNSPDKNPNLKDIAEDLSVPQHDDLSESSVSPKIQNENTASQPDQSARITNKLVQTVQKFLKALQSSIKALQSNKSASSNRVPILEPKSSRPTASIPVTAAVKSTTELLEAETTRQLDNRKELPLGEMTASSRGRDPLSGLPMLDEPITVPSPAATGTKPRLDENVLFQSDTVLGTARDVTNSAKMKEDLEAFAEKGLQAHNRFRTLHHAPSLRWSDELANQAEKLAYEMAMKGVITRSDAVKSLGEGENIAKISRVPFEEAGSSAAEAWYSEKKNYSYSYPRLDEQNDAFTQMVWKNTKELGMGCAKDLQTNDMYVVALYRPAGNDKRLLRANVLNEGEVGRDVYATIFKKDRAEKPVR